MGETEPSGMGELMTVRASGSGCQESTAAYRPRYYVVRAFSGAGWAVSDGERELAHFTDREAALACAEILNQKAAKP